jgi:hypothetical protein
MLMISALLAIGWSVVRTLWIWLTLRMVEHKPSDRRRTAPVSA